ncbi:MAG: c-type cytochrome [Gammaproteobacteria bacterium]|nr:c-type cytochrome [Gammaproteobacteria bacterium]
MKFRGLSTLTLLGLAACATPYDPLEDYTHVDAATNLDAPEAEPGTYAPENRDQVKHGEYLVELLGCGACHTDGALGGDPDTERPLAGSRTGIAYTNPLEHRFPGVVYPSNITPDEETGIGGLSDVQIAQAIRAGVGSHAGRRITVMPWQGYARMSEADINAIVSYLRSIKPIRNKVPAAVPPGTRAQYPYVHFGVYQSR